MPKTHYAQGNKTPKCEKMPKIFHAIQNPTSI